MKKLFLLLALLTVSGAYGMEEELVRSQQEQKELDKQLMVVACSGNVSKIPALIEAGANARTKDSFGRTPLHMVASYGHTQTVKALIEHGADVHAKDGRPSGQTPLHYAANGGHTQTVLVLIARGADVNAKDEMDMKPLHYAALALPLPQFSRAKEGYTQTVLALIECGADVAAKSKDNETPLYLAALKGHTQTVHILLLADQCKNKTEEEIQNSRNRIIALLIYLTKNTQLPCNLQEKEILLRLPEDIFSADMLAALLPHANEEQITYLIQCCPRVWFVQVVRDLSREKRSEVIQVFIDRAREQADEWCKIKEKDGFKTAYDTAKTDELKQLLHPNDPEGKRAAFIREQIEKEFSEEKGEERDSSGKEEDTMDIG